MRDLTVSPFFAWQANAALVCGIHDQWELADRHIQLALHVPVTTPDGDPVRSPALSNGWLLACVWADTTRLHAWSSDTALDDLKVDASGRTISTEPSATTRLAGSIWNLVLDAVNDDDIDAADTPARHHIAHLADTVGVRTTTHACVRTLLFPAVQLRGLYQPDNIARSLHGDT